jgi:hypothetical protein
MFFFSLAEQSLLGIPRPGGLSQKMSVRLFYVPEKKTGFMIFLNV